MQFCNVRQSLLHASYNKHWHSRCITKPCRDALDKLLWRDKDLPCSYLAGELESMISIVSFFCTCGVNVIVVNVIVATTVVITTIVVGNISAGCRANTGFYRKGSPRSGVATTDGQTSTAQLVHCG